MLLLNVWLIALAVRLVFVWAVLANGGTPAPEGSDAQQYASLGRALRATGNYGGTSAMARRVALLRPPGYPLFCAAAMSLGRGDERAILFVQAVVYSTLPVLVALLALRVFAPARLQAWVAGIAAALSPTGLGICGIALADGLLAVVFLAGFIFLYDSAARRRARSLWIAGVLFGLATYLKPVTMYWPVAALAVYFVLATGSAVQRQWWKAAAALIVVPVVLVIPWCVHNQVREGTPAFTTIDAQNLRYFVAPSLEAWAYAGRAPWHEYVYARRERQEARDRLALKTGRETPAQVAARQRSEALLILRRHARHVPSVLWRNTQRVMAAGWGLFELEIPNATPLRGALIFVQWFLRTNFMLTVTCTLSGIAMVGPLLLPPAERTRTRPLHHASLAFFLTYAFFAATACTTFDTGSRILYPAEFTMILGNLAGVTVAVELVRAHVAKRRDAMPTTPAAVSLAFPRHSGEDSPHS